MDFTKEDIKVGLKNIVTDKVTEKNTAKAPWAVAAWRYMLPRL